MDSGGLLFTGLYWERDRPTLTGLVGDREHARAVEVGEAISWEVAGPRRCTGLYDRRQHRRRPCPVDSLVVDEAQCDLCQQADPGRLVARGQAPSGMELEPFVLYLAWFGDGLHKAGITSEKRGGQRLREQAALSYCLVARGPFTSIRQAETLLARVGVAPERVTTHSKRAAWWGIEPAQNRSSQLLALYQAATAAVRVIPGVEVLDFQAVDLAPLFGLGREMPSPFELVVRVRPGAALSGMVTHVIGRDIVLGPSPIVVDSHLLEGWTLRRSSQPSAGFDVEMRSREADARAVQGTLF
jgi:hypothetical protein